MNLYSSPEFALVSEIRRQHREGIHVVYLAANHDLPVEVISAIVRCRTREGAARVCIEFQARTVKEVKQYGSLQCGLRTETLNN